MPCPACRLFTGSARVRFSQAAHTLLSILCDSSHSYDNDVRFRTFYANKLLAIRKGLAQDLPNSILKEDKFREWPYHLAKDMIDKRNLNSK
jgi:hypothetical protein